VSIESSSGHDVLDMQALEMLLQAVRQATVPESLRGKQFAINVPIHFRLAD
jgi:protein TonB